jgi:hypothetical protein
MTRKSQKSSKWVLVAVISVLVLFALIAWLISREATPFRTASSLDIPAYAENASSLRGNTYKVSGEVADSLSWSPTSGYLIAVGVEGNSRLLPILVPMKFSSVNIQKGQRLIFLVEVDEKGILKAKGLKKE